MLLLADAFNQPVDVHVVSLKGIRAFRSMSFIAIVALTAGPIEDGTTDPMTVLEALAIGLIRPLPYLTCRTKASRHIVI